MRCFARGTTLNTVLPVPQDAAQCLMHLEWRFCPLFWSSNKSEEARSMVIAAAQGSYIFSWHVSQLQKTVKVSWEDSQQKQSHTSLVPVWTAEAILHPTHTYSHIHTHKAMQLLQFEHKDQKCRSALKFHYVWAKSRLVRQSLKIIQGNEIKHNFYFPGEFVLT